MAYFQTKNRNLGKFRRVLQLNMSVLYGPLEYFTALWYTYFTALWYIFWQIGIFYGNLVYFWQFGIFSAIWYIFGNLVYIWSFGALFSVLVFGSKKNLASQFPLKKMSEFELTN
jgi:hypothetical protein